MSKTNSTAQARQRASVFATRFGLRTPILMAPMAGACPPELAIAVADGGGMGALGALLDSPAQIERWIARFRLNDESRPLQINLWIPDPPPERDAEHELAVCRFLSGFGPQVSPEAVDANKGLSFDAQCEALIAAKPTAVSSIMGLYPPAFVQRLKEAGIAWFACVTTVSEARAARDAGADVIVAQGAEAGGHRGAFEAREALARSVGLFALLPQVVDAVDVPVVATGGIADARSIGAALLLGASAVQIGTGLLRCDESSVASAWATAIGESVPENTRLTRAFSGRWGRAIANDYVLQAGSSDAPTPAPYPVQRTLTAQMRSAATSENDIEHMQAWAGQSARLAGKGPADELVQRLWDEATEILGG